MTQLSLKLPVRLATLGLCLYGASAIAAADPRTMAMGGAGIASSYGKAAMATNPAQLMSRDYTFDIGGAFGVETENIEDNIDKVDKLKDRIDTITCYTEGCKDRGINKINIKLKSTLNNSNVNQAIKDIATGKRKTSYYLVLKNYDAKSKTANYYPVVSAGTGDNSGTLFANELLAANKQLSDLNNDPMLSGEINLNGGAVYGCLGCLSAYGLKVGSSAQFSATINITDQDTDLINKFANVAKDNSITLNDIDDLKETGFVNYSTTVLKSVSGGSAKPMEQATINAITKNSAAAGAEKINIINPVDNVKVNDKFKDNVTSSLTAVAGVAVDFGVSYATEIELDEYGINRLHLGVTPKIVTVGVAAHTVKMNGSKPSKDDFDFEKKNGVSADIGVAYKIPHTNWNVAAVVRNLIPVKIETSDATVKVGPELAVGSAYKWHNLTFAADLDLTSRELIKDGGRAKQFLSVGGEADLAGWLSLRLGLQHNFASSQIGTRFTGGFGLFRNALQVSAYKGSDEIGGMLAASIQF